MIRSGTPDGDCRIRVMIAAFAPSAVRLATTLSGPHVQLVLVTDLDERVAEQAKALNVDVLVIAADGQLALAQTIAEQVSADASRVTVMIVDDPGATADTRIFWPKDRVHRVASAMEPLLAPSVASLAVA